MREDSSCLSDGSYTLFITDWHVSDERCCFQQHSRCFTCLVLQGHGSKQGRDWKGWWFSASVWCIGINNSLFHPNIRLFAFLFRQSAQHNAFSIVREQNGHTLVFRVSMVSHRQGRGLAFRGIPPSGGLSTRSQARTCHASGDQTIPFSRTQTSLIFFSITGLHIADTGLQVVTPKSTTWPQDSFT